MNLYRLALGADGVSSILVRYLRAGRAQAKVIVSLYKGHDATSFPVFREWEVAEKNLIKIGYLTASPQDFVHELDTGELVDRKIRPAGRGETPFAWAGVWMQVATNLQHCPGAIEMALNLGARISANWVDTATSKIMRLTMQQVPGVVRDEPATEKATLDPSGSVQIS